MNGSGIRILLRFHHNRSAATAVEYALIGALVSIVIIAGATALGTTLNLKFQGVSDAVTAGAP